jgi:hypothetical protein
LASNGEIHENENSKYQNGLWPWTTPARVLLGLPATTGNFFFGFEHPWATQIVSDSEIVFELDARANCDLPITGVVGVAPSGQMRRAFLYYINMERAVPHRSFLTYNSWWTESLDGGVLGEDPVLRSVNLWREYFCLPYNIKLDSYAIDDSWQDRDVLARTGKYVPNPALPNGFKVITEELRKAGSGLGLWFSVGATFDRCNPELNAEFEQECIKYMNTCNVNLFKFDGIDTRRAEVVGPYLKMISNLRKIKPDIFIASTNGTWPSPWWLLHTNTVWRGDGDFPVEYAVKNGGGLRQRWVTSRDAVTYRNVVRMSPLYPISALMTHGICNTWRHSWASDVNFINNRAEILMYFGSGLGLCDLYVSLNLYPESTRKFLAEVIEWSRANTNVLMDSHWIGGNPSMGEVYGFASSSYGKSIIAIRNPTENEATFSLDLGKALELPNGSPQNYLIKEIFPVPGKAPFQQIAKIGTSVNFDCVPLGVTILEISPANK